jgi:hypothetical protein
MKINAPGADADSAKIVVRSDIQPRMEACSKCASFPHTSLGPMPGLMTQI